MPYIIEEIRGSGKLSAELSTESVDKKILEHGRNSVQRSRESGKTNYGI